ncbi:MAG TPA: RNA methyltransferase [Treponemataceae bacterium]|nr:RNA methyltransferase [Treponemataceae bacterium]HPS43706.1 RNA methyltransferase [Treponemataceae bacterium]
MEGFPSLPDVPKPLREFLGMRERDLRAEGLFVAEGRLLVERAIASGLSVLAVVADQSAAAEARALAHGSIPAYECPKDALDAVAGFQFHRGMLAIARRPPAARAGDQNLALRAPAGPILVLPEITDPGNLGTLLRSCLAFGFRAAWLGERSCDPWNRKCLRSSMGAAFSLSLYEAESADLSALSRSGFAVLAAAMEENALVSDAGGQLRAGQLGESIRDGRIALVLGNEHDGIPADWRSACARAVRIPVSTAVDSLNVAVAGSLLMRDFSPPGLR